MMRIGIDVDGVLANFHESFKTVLIRVSGRNLFPDDYVAPALWDYPTHYGYTRREQDAAWATVEASTCFWLQLSPYEDTLTFLDALHAHVHEDSIYFLTCRRGRTAKQQTELWLRQYGWAHPTVLIVTRPLYKSRICTALSFDYLLDDKTETCADVHQWCDTTTPVMLARPWNRPVPNMPRVNALQDFYRCLYDPNIPRWFPRVDGPGDSYAGPIVIPERSDTLVAEMADLDLCGRLSG